MDPLHPSHSTPVSIERRKRESWFGHHLRMCSARSQTLKITASQTCDPAMRAWPNSAAFQGLDWGLKVGEACVEGCEPCGTTKGRVVNWRGDAAIPSSIELQKFHQLFESRAVRQLTVICINACWKRAVLLSSIWWRKERRQAANENAGNLSKFAMCS